MHPTRGSFISMNRNILSLLIAIFFLGSIASKADTPEEFLATYRTALEQKDTNKLLSLYYTEGCTEGDKKMLDALAGFHFSNAKITDVKFEPNPENQQLVNFVNGRKYEPTYLPTGQVKVTYEPVAGNGQISGGDAYAVINGKYYLITSKSTDIGWNGPKDKTLTFMVMGQGMEKVNVHANWNVSGVNQEGMFSNPPSCNFHGQYFESITATSTDDNANLTLTIMEDGKPIYESAPLKGKGTLEYKRQVQK